MGKGGVSAERKKRSTKGRARTEHFLARLPQLPLLSRRRLQDLTQRALNEGFHFLVEDDV